MAMVVVAAEPEAYVRDVEERGISENGNSVVDVVRRPGNVVVHHGEPAAPTLTERGANDDYEERGEPEERGREREVVR